MQDPQQQWRRHPYAQRHQLMATVPNERRPHHPSLTTPLRKHLDREPTQQSTHSTHRPWTLRTSQLRLLLTGQRCASARRSRPRRYLTFRPTSRARSLRLSPRLSLDQSRNQESSRNLLTRRHNSLPLSTRRPQLRPPPRKLYRRQRLDLARNHDQSCESFQPLTVWLVHRVRERQRLVEGPTSPLLRLPFATRPLNSRLPIFRFQSPLSQRHTTTSIITNH